MHRPAHGLVAAKTEAQIGKTTRCLGVGAAQLDLRDRLQKIEPITVVFFHPGRDREDIGIEHDVLGRKADAGKQVIGARADFDLACLGVGLPGFVESHHHHGSAVSHAFAGLVEEGGLALLHADRIDDRLAGHAFQPRLDHAPFGTVDHHRYAGDVGLGADQLEEGRHG